MNKAMLVGRLVADPELKTTGGGVSVCKFTLAVTRRHADASGQRQADFIPVIVWRQQGEACARYLSKGKLAGVVGEIRTRSYDAQDGTKRYVTEIVADVVEFIGGREKGTDTGAQKPAAYNSAQDGFSEFDDGEELPF